MTLNEFYMSEHEIAGSQAIFLGEIVSCAKRPEGLQLFQ